MGDDDDLTDEEFELFMKAPLDQVKTAGRNLKSLGAIEDALGEERFKVFLERLADSYAKGERDAEAMIRRAYEETTA